MGSNEAPRDSTLLEGVSVLIVDDDADIRDAIRSILLVFAADAVAVDCAAGARAVLAARSFDVLLSDVEMPRENGYELMRSVRCSGARDIAAAAVTGRASPDEVRFALAAGFDRVIAKPLDIETLVEAVYELAAERDDDPKRRPRARRRAAGARP
jgi:two-component system CheB/CheR fusion protein